MVLAMYHISVIKMSGNPLCSNEITFDIIKSLKEMQMQSIACNHNSSHMECESFLYIMKCFYNPICN